MEISQNPSKREAAINGMGENFSNYNSYGWVSKDSKILNGVLWVVGFSKKSIHGGGLRLPGTRQEGKE